MIKLNPRFDKIEIALLVAASVAIGLILVEGAFNLHYHTALSQDTLFRVTTFIGFSIAIVYNFYRQHRRKKFKEYQSKPSTLQNSSLVVIK